MQSISTQLFLAFAIIILTAKILGLIFKQLQQPFMVGELLAGVLLGPSLINLLGWSIFSKDLQNPISYIAEIGLLVLVFNAGLEISMGDLRALGRAIIACATLGILLTLALIIPVLLAANFSFEQAAFIAIALAGTGNAVAAQLAFEMSITTTRRGIVFLGAAMIDDIGIFLLLSFLLIHRATDTGEANLLITIVKILVYIPAAFIGGILLLPRIGRWVERLNMEAGLIAFAMVSMMFFGWVATLAGLSAIVGAFIAGVTLSLSSDDIRLKIQASLHSFGNGFLLPIFFVNLALGVSLHEFNLQNIPLVIVITALAILAKVVGCSGGAILGGLDKNSAWYVGWCMVPRGAVGLAITTIGLQNGLLQRGDFPEVMVVILATTIIAPIVVRRLEWTEQTTVNP